MTLSLARRLLRGRAVPSTLVEAALIQASANGESLVQALLALEQGAYVAQVVAQLDLAEVPLIATVRIVPELFALLPPGMPERLLAVPVRRDLRLGTVDVAAVDPYDAHIAHEFAFHLGSSVRVLRAPYGAVTRALAAIAGTAVATSKPASLEVVTDFITPGMPRSEDSARKAMGSQPPITARGIPPASHQSDPTFPLVRRSLPPPALPASPPGRPIQTEPLEAVRKARTPAEVVEALSRAAVPLGCDVVVFAAKGGVYRAQRCSIPSIDPTSLAISTQEMSVLSAAAERGSYFGSLPDTEAHAALRAALPGAANSEVYVVPVKVGQRAVLVLLLSRFEHAYAVTRRADALAQAASSALTELVRTGRK